MLLNYTPFSFNRPLRIIVAYKKIKSQHLNYSMHQILNFFSTLFLDVQTLKIRFKISILSNFKLYRVTTARQSSTIIGFSYYFLKR